MSTIETAYHIVDVLPEEVTVQNGLTMLNSAIDVLHPQKICNDIVGNEDNNINNESHDSDNNHSDELTNPELMRDEDFAEDSLDELNSNDDEVRASNNAQLEQDQYYQYYHQQYSYDLQDNDEALQSLTGPIEKSKISQSLTTPRKKLRLSFKIPSKQKKALKAKFNKRKKNNDHNHNNGNVILNHVITTDVDQLHNVGTNVDVMMKELERSFDGGNSNDSISSSMKVNDVDTFDKSDSNENKGEDDDDSNFRGSSLDEEQDMKSSAIEDEDINNEDNGVDNADDEAANEDDDSSDDSTDEKSDDEEQDAKSSAIEDEDIDTEDSGVDSADDEVANEDDDWVDDSIDEKSNDELEQREILRNAIATGVFDMSSTNPHGFKLFVSKGAHISPLIERRLQQWQPDIGFQVLAYMYCQHQQPQSLFDQASQVIWCIAVETKVDEWDILSLKGFALNNPNCARNKMSKGFLVRYVKVFNMKKVKVNHDAHHKYALQADLEDTIKRLTGFLDERYKQVQPAVELQVKKADLLWSSPKKLKNHLENLIQVFHTALIITDYIFNFTKRDAKSNDVDTTYKLIPFCAKMFSKITTFRAFWSSADKLLRIFDNDVAKRQKKNIICNMKRWPSQFVNYLDDNINEPETYRATLLQQMEAAFIKRTSIKWRGCIQEKDMYIVRFYILNHEFKNVNDITKVLYLKNSTRAELQAEEQRHKRLLQLPDEDNSHNETTLPTIEEVHGNDDAISKLPDNGLDFFGNQNNIAKRSNKSPRHGEEDQEDPGSNSAIADLPLLDSDINKHDAVCDDTVGTNSINKRSIEGQWNDEEHQDAAGDNSTSPNVPVPDGDVTNGRVQERNCPSVPNHAQQITAGKGSEAGLLDLTINGITAHDAYTHNVLATTLRQTNPQATDIDTTRTSVVDTTTTHNRFQFEGLFNEGDVNNHGMMLTINIHNTMRQFVMMSVTQLMWTTKLHHAQHRVTTKAQEEIFLKFDPTIGHMWLTPTCSYVDKNFAVLRRDHPYFRKNFQTCLGKLDINLICDFLQEKGRQDTIRDNKSIPSFRVDIGFGNHNYEKDLTKRASASLFRPQPKMCRIDELQKYSPDLGTNISMLLDSMQRALDETYEKELHLDSPLSNEYIKCHFVEPMRKKLGCTFFAFTNFTLTLFIIDDQDIDGSYICNTDDEDEEIHPLATSPPPGDTPIGASHEDTLNGRQEGNNLSLIFHMLLQFKHEGDDKIYYGRFSVIAYTRSCCEFHEQNENLLVDLKEELKNFERKVNTQYKLLRETNKFADESLSFINPEKMFLDENIVWEKIDIGNESIQCVVPGLFLPVTYASEISTSAGITVLRRCLLRLKSTEKDISPERKVLEVLVLAAYQNSWGRFFHAGQFVLNQDNFDWSTNLTISMATLMKTNYGGTHGGLFMRGHPSNVDIISYYSNETNLEKAKNAIEKFLRRLNDPRALSKQEYKQALIEMITDLPGIGQFYGQRIPLLAACSGIILKTNLQRATWAYPVRQMGSHNAITKFNARHNKEEECNNSDYTSTIADKIEACKLDATPEGFAKTAQLACSYSNLQDSRMNWAENMFCEGLGGRSSEVRDIVFPHQSLFWIFKTNGSPRYQVKEKKYNNKLWSPLQ